MLEFRRVKAAGNTEPAGVEVRDRGPGIESTDNRGDGLVGATNQELIPELDPPRDALGVFGGFEALPADLIDVRDRARRPSGSRQRLTDQYPHKDCGHCAGGARPDW